MSALTLTIRHVAKFFFPSDALQASSLLILPPRGEVVFYEDAHFRGKSHSFNTDIPSLTSLGQNDKYSSVKTDPATAVEVFADKDFKGKSVIWSGAVPEFGAFNDKVTQFSCTMCLPPSGFVLPHSQVKRVLHKQSLT